MASVEATNDLKLSLVKAINSSLHVPDSFEGLLKQNEDYCIQISALALKMSLEATQYQQRTSKKTYDPTSPDFCLAVATKDELKLATSRVQLYNETRMIDTKSTELLDQKQRKDLSDSLSIPIQYQIGVKLVAPNDKKKGFFLFQRMDDTHGRLLRFVIWNRLIQRFSFGKLQPLLWVPLRLPKGNPEGSEGTEPT
jgi:hypothetical protein